MATNHWSVSMGSITWPVRAQRGTMSLCFFGFHQQAGGFQVGDDGLARGEAVDAAVFGRRVVVDGFASSVSTPIMRQAVALADRVVVEIVRRA
jgi:hypothetical protein